MTDTLTPQEQLVVDTMRDDVTEAECARRLRLSPHTVHAYLKSARAKANVRSTRALVAKLARTHEQA